jgi:TolB-like protein/Flp pilus assembly protein TadD
LLGLVTLIMSSKSRQVVIGATAQSVAVLPFRTIGAGPDDEYLGTGIPDAIVLALMNISELRVRPMRASLKFAGANQDPVEAGKALQVDAILEGTVSRAGANLRVTARLLRVEDGALLWEVKASDEFDSLLRAQDLIPVQIADALHLKMSEQERALVAKRYTDNPEAYQLYLKGRHFLNRRNSMNAKQALDSLEKAIKVDPSYALAIAGLAHIHTLLVNPLPAFERMQKAKAEATRALEIDGTLAEAHMALGRALIYCDWDWAGSEKAFTRAIELCPNYPDAHFWYSHSLTALGRHDEALAELKRALESDPFSSRYALRVGWALYLAREYDRAIEEFRKTPFEVDSNYYTVYRGLGLAYVEKSMYKEAISMFEKAEVLSGEIPLVKATLAYTHAKSGNYAEARRLLDELAALPGGEVPSMVLVGTYGYLGEGDKAVNLLETIYEKRLSTLIGVKVEPMLDSVRSDPRFEEILRRIGLAL